MTNSPIISLSYNLAAVPKGRPRVAVKGRFPSLYTPKRTAEFEAEIAIQTKKQQSHDVPFSADTRLSVGILIKTSRKAGDVDNLAKSILDGIVKAETVMVDDAQIDVLCVTRRFVKKGQELITVLIRPVGPDEQ